jgi:formylglycine-generating enzyme required for sulfatase activity
MRKWGFLGAACLVASLLASFAAADDVVYGPERATLEVWRSWMHGMRALRADTLRKAGFDDAAYKDPAAAWSSRSFRQFFLFMYDQSFFDGHYRTAKALEEWTRLYGPIDSVLLWHAYPRIGFDERGQFDYYKDMPGGLAGLRREVVDVLHARGVRVFIDFNPWDEGATYQELAHIVGALDIDGVMLDTMEDVPAAMKAAVDAVKRGVIFAPERRPSEAQLAFAKQSWAQWYDLGDLSRPSIYLQKWLVPAHQMFAIRRWDTERRSDLIYSFFNGTGMLLWDNIFGSWNPYSPEDRLLLAETGAVLGSYAGLTAAGEWSPLIPTGVEGLDANRWVTRDGRALYLLRNRTDRELRFAIPRARRAGLEAVAFWPEAGAVRGNVAVPAHGVQGLALDESAHALDAVAAFKRARNALRADAPEYAMRTPVPALVSPAREPAPGFEPGMSALPGGAFTMTIDHKRRECGCYPFGASGNPMSGYYFEDPIHHELPVTVSPFAMRRAAVTNAEFVAFVHASGYRPAEPANFLRQLPREADGSLPRRLPAELGALPVTYVSLSDARAYGHWKHQRLPSEAEWQWAAEGAGRGRKWPWGDAFDDSRVNRTGRLAAATAYASGATAQGILQMTGNAWELTESEYSDGHTRFVMLRGGSFLPPARSEWIVERGPRPNHSHTKYILMSDSLDRSAAVTFRTVADLR